MIRMVLLEFASVGLPTQISFVNGFDKDVHFVGWHMVMMGV